MYGTGSVLLKWLDLGLIKSYLSNFLHFFYPQVFKIQIQLDLKKK
jgi:hypothetical protein